MTVKCEKCGADVELLDGAKSAKCEKCGAEVTVKEEAAAEATEEQLFRHQHFCIPAAVCYYHRQEAFQ